MIDFRQQPPGFQQGIYEMSFEQYASIPALNSSKLKKMRKSPLHFKTAVEDPELDAPDAAKQRTFDKGKAFDLFVLEGGLETLKNRVSVEPDLHRGTKAYKEWRAEQPADALLLTRDEMADVIAMASAAWKKQQFSRLFHEGHSHRVLIWQDPDSGLWCKAELDWITPDGIIVDLKSTADAGFWFFSRNARRLGYLNQAAHYCRGLSIITGYLHADFRFAAVETVKPYESHVFQVEREQLMEAEDFNKDAMVRIAECLDAEQWPGYLDEVISLQSGQYHFNYGDDSDLDALIEMEGIENEF